MPHTARPLRVTVVCTGNICRSPMGEVILREMLAEAGLADRVQVDSAGTTRWEIGNPMDPRAVMELRRHGYDGSAHVARVFEPEWIAGTDLVLAADRGHAAVLRRWARTPTDAAKVRMMRSFDDAAVKAGTLEIDDPWYGDQADFTRTFEELEPACAGVVAELETRLGTGPAGSSAGH